ncbi:MAG: magnesium transporter [Spirochaetales bacterium]|uniref:Magnesium transporter MgtE n=1 Tax=Candidatus Thalassospirochaeta sargassi TaxID=3119039 RepID=A0AAJ1II05_9SPIO|nr:magnesium transporter [Spirochaetales bacterium]
MELKEKLNIDGTPPEELKKILAEMPLADILEEWDTFNDEEALRIMVNLPVDNKVDLLNALSNTEQEKLIESLSAQSINQILSEMDPDDLADFIQSVSPEVRREAWNSLSEDAKKETLFLLRFDEDDAAGLMTPRYLAVRAGITVAQTLHFVRRGAQEVETVYYIYILDEFKRLQGVVSLRELLMADDSELVNDIMETNYISVHEETDQEEVAKTLETYDLIALPVLDNRNQLLGIVTFDDIIDVIREEHTEDTYKMGAMTGNVDRYLDSSVWGLVKKRIPWLIVLLLLGTFSTNVVNHYSGLITTAAFLFIFMPVITQTGGNSGSQASTLMIRGLATGEIHSRDAGKILFKEIAVGILMGLITGAVIIIRGYFLPPGIGFQESLTIGISLAFVVLFSTLVGTLAPLLINRMGFDPTVMSAPLMATVIDIAGLTIYFEIAKMLMI